LNTKNAFSAAQNRSKRTVGKTANNSTNATIAGGNLYKETGLMLINYGTCIHPENNLHSN
jgi:hypothetical protein